MKVYLFLFISLAFTGRCGSSTADQQEILTIVYQAESRGLYLRISAQQRILRLQEMRNNEGATIKLSSKNWNDLTAEIKKIELDQLAALETEQSGQALDRAAIAHLTIVTADKSYTTSPFDHGNPPKAIAEVVKLLLELTKTVEGQ